MKNIIFVILALLLYAGSLKFKDNLRLSNAQQTPPTLGDIRGKKGIPVYGKKLQKSNFQNVFKISGKVNDDFSLSAEVTREVIQQISLDNEVYLKYIDKSYSGKLVQITRKPNIYTGLYSLKVQFKKLPKDTIGKVLLIEIVYQEKQNVLKVERNSVSLREEVPFVYIVNSESKLVKKEVHISYKNDDFFVIDKGLSIGELYVTSDTRDLSENDFVYVVREEER